jgi:hypothetical protein
LAERLDRHWAAALLSALPKQREARSSAADDMQQVDFALTSMLEENPCLVLISRTKWPPGLPGKNGPEYFYALLAWLNEP